MTEPVPVERASFGRRLGILWLLYFVQGLPYGFQVTALPVYLREAGTSLTAIGLASLLSLPWMLKVVWGPIVDRFDSGPLGRRRSWIVPLQLMLATASGAAVFVASPDRLRGLVVIVFIMNLAAATMDVAVDGLAVDLLEPQELGPGNIAQVVGYKLGMLTGGGLLVWASGWIGWSGLFGSMALLTAGAVAVTLAWREPSSGQERARPSVGAIGRHLWAAVSSNGAIWLLVVVGSYKLGEAMADTMFRPFLYDAGFGREQIGLWVGTYGMVFSIVGSIVGGLLAARIGLWRALFWTAVFRAGPIAGVWWLSVAGTDAGRVIAVTCAESFFGGALTTAMFAFMMSRVDRRIGASHFTVLATVEVWGKVGASMLSGLVADSTSYSFVFGVATVFSIGFVALVPLVRSPGGGRSSARSPG